MDLKDDIGLEQAWKELQENSSFSRLFEEPKKPEYLDIKFDFSIDPDHFIRWRLEQSLKDAEDEFDWEYKPDDYRHNVGSECEYSCLYIAMLLRDTELESEPVIYCGNFGFWEHYWIGYTWKGQEYFLDLTLMQFLENSPKLAISLPSNDKNGYNWFEDIEPETISHYLERQRAVNFYLDPKKVK